MVSEGAGRRIIFRIPSWGNRKNDDCTVGTSAATSMGNRLILYDSDLRFYLERVRWMWQLEVAYNGRWLTE